MSIAICRVQKIGSPKDIAGIQIHNRREREHSNTNPDIDYSLSFLNYTLTIKPDESVPNGFTVQRQNAVEGSGKPYNALVEKRIRDAYTGKKAVRKDAVRCCEVLFTASGDFFAKHKYQTEDFFKSCMIFAAKRFGAENIIAATVHRDEKTPHLHLDFVPLTADGRLSAKSVLGGRKEMQELQDDFYEQVGKKYGLQRGSRADLDAPEAEKPRKHLTTQRLKLQTAKQSLENTKREFKRYEQMLIKTDRDLMTVEDQLEIAEKKLVQQEQQLAEKELQLAEISARIDELKKKELDPLESMNNWVSRAFNAEQENKTLRSTVEQQEIKVKELENDVGRLIKERDDWKNNFDQMKGMLFTVVMAMNALLGLEKAKIANTAEIGDEFKADLTPKQRVFLQVLGKKAADFLEEKGLKKYADTMRTKCGFSQSFKETVLEELRKEQQPNFNEIDPPIRRR
jgi:hypothetical protein